MSKWESGPAKNGKSDLNFTKTLISSILVYPPSPRHRFCRYRDGSCGWQQASNSQGHNPAWWNGIVGGALGDMINTYLLHPLSHAVLCYVLGQFLVILRKFQYIELYTTMLSHLPNHMICYVYRFHSAARPFPLQIQNRLRHGQRYGNWEQIKTPSFFFDNCW